MRIALGFLCGYLAITPMSAQSQLTLDWPAMAEAIVERLAPQPGEQIVIVSHPGIDDTAWSTETMSDALEYLGYGLLLGLSGGLTPGPVTTLVITHTLRHGFREGLKITIAPLVTDLPLILLTVFVFSRLADAGMLIGGIALVGAGYLAYLARETFNAPPLSAVPSAEGPRSFRTGLIANVLNPNPYLFWSVVGAPTL